MSFVTLPWYASAPLPSPQPTIPTNTYALLLLNSVEPNTERLAPHLYIAVSSPLVSLLVIGSSYEHTTTMLAFVSAFNAAAIVVAFAVLPYTS